MTASLPPSDPLTEVAAGQYGLITLEQALTAGWTRTDIARRLAERSWLTVRLGVYRSAASPVTWRQRALAACIGKGGAVAVSHGSAAYLHGLVVQRPRLIEVVLPYSSSLKGIAATVRPHRTRRPPGPAELVVVEAIPTTCIARTLTDIATARDGREAVQVADLLDRAMVTCRTDRDRVALAESVAKTCCRALNGSAALREALEPWLNATGPESVLEAQVLRTIERAGLPRPELQHRLDLPTGPVYLDFAWPDRRVALEVDGYRFHSGRSAFDRDRVRGNALLLAGWNVLHTTAGQLTRDRAALVETIRLALGSGLATRRR